MRGRGLIVERIKLSLPTEMWAKVKKRAKAEGTSGAAWIRRAIVERLEREGK
jgi:hypothetical protein